MGVFIICWLPFFIYNVITGIFKASLSKSHEFIYSMVTWLGYINSGCNPIIYAFSSRDFRRAFARLLCPKSFLLKNKRLNVTSGPSYVTNNIHYESSNNALYQNKKTIKPPPCITCQMYENSLFTLTSKVATSNPNEIDITAKKDLKSEEDSERSVLLGIPSTIPFPTVSFDQEDKNDNFKIAINSSPLMQEENSNAFELIKYNLIKLNSLIEEKKYDSIYKNPQIETGSDEIENLKIFQTEKNCSFSSSLLAAETSKRESQRNKPLTKFTRNLRRTFRNVLNQNSKPRRAATTIFSKKKQCNNDMNRNKTNNVLQRRRVSASSITSSNSLNVLNKLHTSANQTSKRGLKKKILLANNLISEELNSISNKSIQSVSNSSLYNLSQNKKQKTISIGTTIKFKQTKLLSSQEREMSDSSFQMSINKKHKNQTDAESQNLNAKKVNF
jgi:hypothetical protein